MLAKLPLRSLSLQFLWISAEGMAALGELPLLERLELRDCSGLAECDLRALYHLRQLRALTLCGVGAAPKPMEPVALGQPISIQLPEVRDGKFVERIDAEWMAGLAKALPNLRELDLSSSRIDDEVLAALPPRLRSLGLRDALGFTPAKLVALSQLAELQELRCGGWGQSASIGLQTIDLTDFDWPALLPKLQNLRRLDYAGFPNERFLAALPHLVELRELRFGYRTFSFAVYDAKGYQGEQSRPGRLPSFATLADLQKLTKIELVAPSSAFEQAIRAAVPDRVMVEIVGR